LHHSQPKPRWAPESIGDAIPSQELLASGAMPGWRHCILNDYPKVSIFALKRWNILLETIEVIDLINAGIYPESGVGVMYGTR
jgi:hypothetical protein